MTSVEVTQIFLILTENSSKGYEVEQLESVVSRSRTSGTLITGKNIFLLSLSLYRHISCTCTCTVI